MSVGDDHRVVVPFARPCGPGQVARQDVGCYSIDEAGVEMILVAETMVHTRGNGVPRQDVLRVGMDELEVVRLGAGRTAVRSRLKLLLNLQRHIAEAAAWNHVVRELLIDGPVHHRRGHRREVARAKRRRSHAGVEKATGGDSNHAVAKEEERLVLEDRTAHVETATVLFEGRFFLLIKVTGVQRRVDVVVVEAAVQLVCAALAGQPEAYGAGVFGGLV